jgi:nicotinamide-nucleotide amidase
VLVNPAGSAPGLLLAFERSVLIVLPGPPREVEAMLEEALAAGVDALTACGCAPAGSSPATAELRVAGMGESGVAERLAGAEALEAPGLDVAFLASPGDVRVKLRAGDAALVTAAAAAVRERLGLSVFSETGESLAEVLVGLLAEREETVGAIESCTGGLVTGALTAVPGSSAVLRAGLVVYSNDAKVGLAGVPPMLLEAHGAVSEETVRALAAGGRRSVQADWVLAVTGVAGPGGGTEDKPVGTVWTAIAGPDGEVRARLLRLPGSRELVRGLTVSAVLNDLRLRLLE